MNGNRCNFFIENKTKPRPNQATAIAFEGNEASKHRHNVPLHLTGWTLSRRLCIARALYGRLGIELTCGGAESSAAFIIDQFQL